MAQLQESVVITGCGWITPFGAGSIPDVLEAAKERAPAAPEDESYRAIPDGFRDDWPDFAPELKSDHGTLFTAAALEHALSDASLRSPSRPSERVGMVLGCALAGQLGMIQFAEEVRAQSSRFVSPIHFPQTVGNYISGALARAYDIRGPVLTVSCGAASGLDAVVEGARLIATGRADLVVAGGTERLAPQLAIGLAQSGLHLSDGACLFVLESEEHAAKRGARVWASMPPPSGDTMSIVSRRPDGGVMSGTDAGELGTIVIGYWIGQCFAALGSGAVAAAIGAVGGRDVPLVTSTDPPSVSVGSASFGEERDTESWIPAVVFADNDQGFRTTVLLSCSRTR